MASEKVAEKYHQLEPANGHTRGDEESATMQSEELKRQKKIKMYKIIGIVLVFQVVVFTVFGISMNKIRSPKIMLGKIYVQTINSSVATPSFDMTFRTQIRVRNLNWGTFKYDAGNVTFMYQGVAVGNVLIPKGKARMRSTKRMSVVVSLNSKALPSNSGLGNELSSGLLRLGGQGKLNGKVRVVMMLKKQKKTAEMSCTMGFNLATKSVQDLECN